jgi:hypothetical protein
MDKTRSAKVTLVSWCLIHTKCMKCGIEIGNLDYTKGSYIHDVMINFIFFLLLIRSCFFSQFVVISHVGNNFGYYSRDWG